MGLVSAGSAQAIGNNKATLDVKCFEDPANGTFGIAGDPVHVHGTMHYDTNLDVVAGSVNLHIPLPDTEGYYQQFPAFAPGDNGVQPNPGIIQPRWGIVNSTPWMFAGDSQKTFELGISAVKADYGHGAGKPTVAWVYFLQDAFFIAGTKDIFVDSHDITPDGQGGNFPLIQSDGMFTAGVGHPDPLNAGGNPNVSQYAVIDWNLRGTPQC